jgi:hypothetical protein
MPVHKNGVVMQLSCGPPTPTPGARRAHRPSDCQRFLQRRAPQPRENRLALAGTECRLCLRRCESHSPASRENCYLRGAFRSCLGSLLTNKCRLLEKTNRSTTTGTIRLPGKGVPKGTGIRLHKKLYSFRALRAAKCLSMIYSRVQGLLCS